LRERLDSLDKYQPYDIAKKKGTMSISGDISQLDDLTWKLKEAKNTIKDLKSDIVGLKKIQAE
jgi:plasmid replication initiation protein